ALMRLPQRSPSPSPSPVRRSAIARGEMASFLADHGRTLALVLGAIAMFGFAFGGLLAWTPVAMARLYGVSPEGNGFGMGVAIAAGCLVGIAGANLLMRRLVPVLGYRATLRICWGSMLCAAPVTLCLLLITAPWQAYVLL